jgi:hypothetical protein
MNEARETLQRAGVGNHSRAAYIRGISSVITGRRAPIFVQLQPKLLPHDTEAWENAFSVVCQYLIIHKLALTLETCRIEAHDLVRDQGTVYSCSRLLTTRPPRLGFAQRVKESRLVDNQFANPVVEEESYQSQTETQSQSPTHLIDLAALPKKDEPATPPSFAGAAKRSFTTPVDELSDPEDDFSSDFHIDDIIPPRK